MNEGLEDALKESLRDELASQFEILGNTPKGTDDCKQIVQNICNLTDALNKINQTEMDAFDKQERRMNDKEKNDNLYTLESEKAQFDWKRSLWDLTKIVVPGMISYAFYTKNFRDTLKFEETGRISSQGGREATRLSQIFSFFKWR